MEEEQFQQQREQVRGKPQKVIVFHNGMVAVFNEYGEQMSQFQGNVQFAFSEMQKAGIEFGSYQLTC